MTYNITITFEHGELSLEDCKNHFSTEQLEDNYFEALGLGKAKKVTIILNNNNYGKETDEETDERCRSTLSPF